MALYGGQFADWLHKAGAMSSREYARWQRFERRVVRLGVRHGDLPSEALESFTICGQCADIKKAPNHEAGA
jgi:hypothetical protein